MTFPEKPPRTPIQIVAEFRRDLIELINQFGEDMIEALATDDEEKTDDAG